MTEITKLIEEAYSNDTLSSPLKMSEMIDRLIALLRRLASGVPAEDAALIEKARGALSLRSDEAGLLLGLLTDALERAHAQVVAVGEARDGYEAAMREAQQEVDRMRAVLKELRPGDRHVEILRGCLYSIDLAQMRRRIDWGLKGEEVSNE